MGVCVCVCIVYGMYISASVGCLSVRLSVPDAAVCLLLWPGRQSVLIDYTVLSSAACGTCMRAVPRCQCT